MTKAHPQTWQRPHPDLSVFVLEQLIEAPFCGQLLTDFSAEDMVFAFNESGKSAGIHLPRPAGIGRHDVSVAQWCSGQPSACSPQHTSRAIPFLLQQKGNPHA